MADDVIGPMVALFFMGRPWNGPSVPSSGALSRHRRNFVFVVGEMITEAICMFCSSPGQEVRGGRQMASVGAAACQAASCRRRSH